MQDVQIRLSGLWVALMLTYLLGNVLRIYAGDGTPGEIRGVRLTDALVLAIALLLAIPIVMVVLTLTVGQPFNRWANIVAAIGLALGHVAVSTRLKAAVVAEAVGRTGPGGPDALAQARLKRERERAALQFARDRDVGRLEATMARLDAEAQAARQRPSRMPTAAEARAYLESLPDLWAATSDAGRKAIAEAVFERIDVLGVRDYTFTLTAAAKARGWDAAFGPGVLRLEQQGGRGNSPTLQIGPGEGDLSTTQGQSGRGERHCPATTDLVVMRLAEPPERCEWLRSA